MIVIKKSHDLPFGRCSWLPKRRWEGLKVELACAAREESIWSSRMDSVVFRPDLGEELGTEQMRMSGRV